ncbi:hypothetical protein HPP92_015964 [Vanilla planifolia]|uniref:Uncharacterized protein n=1 Tax=Vanilla planifolia TaxID=51239 RepID=A0A835QSL3_VANPL|nr:hypothetical protein HPP92_015964 [Vanilla planifolia]
MPSETTFQILGVINEDQDVYCLQEQLNADIYFPVPKQGSSLSRHLLFASASPAPPFFSFFRSPSSIRPRRPPSLSFPSAPPLTIPLTPTQTPFDDADNDAFDGSADDRIDELDFLDEDKRLVTTADDADADDPDRGSGSGLLTTLSASLASRLMFGFGINAEEEALPEDQERVGGHGGESPGLQKRVTKWLEGKGDFSTRLDAKIQPELFNPKNHPCTGLTLPGRRVH